MWHLIDAVADCLDRESARRIAQLNLPAELTVSRRETAELHVMTKSEQDESVGQLMNYVAGEFVAGLQLRSRGILRKPVHPKPTPRSK
jgi:hypothetical protein